MAGPTAVSYAPAQKLVSKQTAGFNSMLNKQNAQQDTLFSKYTKASKAQPKLASVLSNAQQDRGINELQSSINLFNNQITDTKGLIDRLNENTLDRVGGTGANKAYLDRMRAAEGGQLNTSLSRLSAGLEPAVNAYGLASQDISQLLAATQADQSKALQPLEMRINALGDRYARQITGYTQNSQNALDVLLNKIQSKQQLNNMEWQQAADLAKQERAYQQQRSLQAEQAAIDKANRQSAIDSFTGKPQESLIGDYTFKPFNSGAGSGFQFTGSNGKPVTAGVFAKQNDLDIGSLLARMGGAGDVYANELANQIKGNMDWFNNPRNLDVIKSTYPQVFGGL